MFAEQKNYQRYDRMLMVVVGVAMLGWAIPYGVANYKFEQCSQELQTRLDAIKAEIAKRQSEIDGAKKPQ